MKKSFLFYHQKQEHVKLAKHSCDFSWNHVVGSDETKVEVFDNKLSGCLVLCRWRTQTQTGERQNRFKVNLKENKGT